MITALWGYIVHSSGDFHDIPLALSFLCPLHYPLRPSSVPSRWLLQGIDPIPTRPVRTRWISAMSTNAHGGAGGGAPVVVPPGCVPGWGGRKSGRYVTRRDMTRRVVGELGCSSCSAACPCGGLSYMPCQRRNSQGCLCSSLSLRFRLASSGH